MSIQRKLHKPEFKAKVAIAALRGDETTSQLSSKFGVHSTMISGWKRTLVEGAASLFEKAGRTDDRKEMETTIDELYRQIGQLKVERDFLSKRNIAQDINTQRCQIFVVHLRKVVPGQEHSTPKTASG